MKKVRIHTGKVGLVFKNGNYQKVITEGVYWLGWSQKVMIFDLTRAFHAPIALNLLIKDQQLADMLHIVEVKDHEIVLHYEDQNFKGVLTPGRYTFWKGVIEHRFVTANLNELEIPKTIDKSLLTRYELTKYTRVFEVLAYEKAVLLIDDVFEKVLDSGIYRYWKNDTSVKINKVDLRQLQLEIAGQELLTKDKAALRVNFFTKYKVVDILKAVMDNKDFEKQLYITMQLALREFVGAYTLDELLERKDEVGAAVMKTVTEKVKTLGVKVLDCGIRDIILPGEMKEIMNQVLVAQKKAQANIITRREETASTRSLLNTAKLMEENEMLYKLKEMEYVEKIAEKIGEITVSGNGNMVKQLKDIFSVNR